MKEIREAIYDRMEQDTIIQGHTGYTAADTRIYLEFPPEDIAVNVTIPAYITYVLSKPTPIDLARYVEDVQRLDIIVEINVWANHPDTADDMAERITNRFRDREWLTTNYRALKTDKESEEDITEIHGATGQITLYRKYLRFRLWPVYKR